MADRLVYKGEVLQTQDTSIRVMGLTGLGLASLYSRESPVLCANGSLNFVGSLLAGLHTDEYREVLNSEGLSGFEFRDPYIVEKIPLVALDKTVSAPHVLHSRAHKIGPEETRLVLTGEYAGMIFFKDCGFVSPERFFNDEPIPADQKKYRPYTPIFLEDEPGEMIPVMQRLEEIFKKHYYDLVDTVRSVTGKKNIHSSDLLFYLCSRLGIPVDRQGFCMTRAK